MMENEAQIHAVLSEYGFIPPYSLSVLAGGTANANYNLQCDQGRFVLRRRSPKYSDLEWIQYEIEYLEYLSDKDIPVPVPLRNRRGEGCTVLNKDVYQLFKYMDGESFDPQNDQDIAEAGAFLGRLHRNLVDFQPVSVKNWPRYDDPHQMLAILQTAMTEHRLCISSEEKEILDYLEMTVRQIADSIPDKKYHAFPKVIVHGDYHPANVKYRDRTICALFDFDWISTQPRLKDVVDGLIYFSGIRPAWIDGGSIYSLTQGCTFEVERSQRFIQAYQRNQDYPLQTDEMVAIPDLMRARLIHSRMQALPKITADQHIMMLTRDIEIPLTWLDHHQDQLIRTMVDSQ